MATLRLLSLVTWALICAGAQGAAGGEEEGVDAREGDEVTLACRAAPPPAAAEPLAYYWVRSGALQQPDNVAVGAVPLQTGYRVLYEPQAGRYDLVISNATYERDNGRFECRVKEHGSGRKMHAQAYQLVVLRAPSAPRVSPAPVARAQEGRALSLACYTSGGSPEPSVKWYRDGSPYPLEGNVTSSGGASTLQLQPAREDDGARFRCVVWNRALPPGQQLDAAVQLSVDYYPRVTVGPANPLRVELGGAARLECSADAKPAAGAVRWSRRGQPAPAAAADGALELRRVALEDAGEYVCSADNGLGRAGEARLALDVQFGPVVALPAAALEAEEGAAVRLPCNVSANPPPRALEWLKEGDDAFRQRGAALELAAVAAADAGTYTCRATNALTTADGRRAERSGAASVALLVRHRPGRARVSPERAVAPEGAAVTLSCAAEPPGWPAPQYRWFRSPPGAGGGGPALAAGDVYTVGSASLGSEGEYYCQATNELGHGAAGAATLRVQQPPRFQSKPPAVAARRAGERGFSVACAAAGKPRPRATWRRGAAELPAGGEQQLEVREEPLEPLGLRSTLTFRGGLQPADAGLYTCVFENEVKKIEATVNLKIEHEPIVIEHRERVAFDPGETAELECRVLAYPEPRFSWSFGGAPLAAGGAGGRLALDGGAAAAGAGWAARLRLTALAPADYGEYACRAENALGAAAATVRLTRKGAPAAPRDLRAAPLPAAAALRWTPGFDGGLPGTKFFVSYRREAADDAGGGAGGGAGGAGCARGDTQWREVECGRAAACNVTGLDQHQHYLFKVKAVNTMGQSEYSAAAAARAGVGELPAPAAVWLAPRGRLALRVPAACLPLVAVPELPAAPAPAAGAPATGAGAPWRSLPPLPLALAADEPTDHEFTLNVPELQGEAEEEAEAEGAGRGERTAPRLRVRLCLADRPEQCGAPVAADARAAGGAGGAGGAALSAARAAALAAAGAALAAAAALLLAYCRRRARRAAPGKPGKPAPAPGPAPPPYYPSSGMENAALEHSLELALALDDCKPYRPDQYYCAPQPGDWSAAEYAAAAGYSPLARAASGHSQDSLWQLKAAPGAGAGPPPPGPPPAPAPHYARFADYGYPAAAPPPAPARDCCGDPYASVHKPKKRPDQMLESPYHEVSGLPEAGGGGAGGGAGGGGGGGGALSLSYDESLESGYSTPNSRARRVIREIIV